MKWQTMESAPWEREVLLKGDSGYIPPHDKFIINGYRVKDWHQGDWNDATGTRLSERGWEPTEWAEIEEKSKPAIPERVCEPNEEPFKTEFRFELAKRLDDWADDLMRGREVWIPGNILKQAAKLLCSIQAATPESDRISALEVQVLSLTNDIKAADLMLRQGDQAGALHRIREAAVRSNKSYLNLIGKTGHDVDGLLDQLRIKSTQVEQAITSMQKALVEIGVLAGEIRKSGDMEKHGQLQKAWQALRLAMNILTAPAIAESLQLASVALTPPPGWDEFPVVPGKSFPWGPGSRANFGLEDGRSVIGTVVALAPHEDYVSVFVEEDSTGQRIECKVRYCKDPFTPVDHGPSWSEAPPWANWKAADSNGAWYWYENEPLKSNTSDCFRPFGRFEGVEWDGDQDTYDDWRETLQERPKA